MLQNHVVLGLFPRGVVFSPIALDLGDPQVFAEQRVSLLAVWLQGFKRNGNEAKYARNGQKIIGRQNGLR
jgi:hypothetical protein